MSDLIPNTVDQYRYDGDYRIKFDDSPAVDAFGRLRVGLPRGQFEYQNQYNTAPLVWEDITEGTGTITHLPLESAVLLSTGGTADGAKAIRQTRQYFRYRPGRSMFLLFTGVLGYPGVNACSRAGYFDDRNGVFFLADENGFSVVIRSDTSGTPVDNVIPQSQWNGNKLDGVMQDNVDIDPTKAIIGWIDLEWLGVGRVRFGVVAHGKFYVVHQQSHTNLYDKVYMRTANLPIRYEVDNHGVTAGPTTIKTICASLSVEGDGDPEQGYDYATDTGATLASLTAAKSAILAIRPKATFEGQVNRASIDLHNLSLMADARAVRWELVYNPTITGGAWASVGAASTVEVNTTMTGYTGGIPIETGFIPAGANIKAAIDQAIASRYPFGLSRAGDAPTSFVVVAQGIGGTASVAAGLGWREFY